jgi:hypothetical protein
MSEIQRNSFELINLEDDRLKVGELLQTDWTNIPDRLNLWEPQNSPTVYGI